MTPRMRVTCNALFPLMLALVGCGPGRATLPPPDTPVPPSEPRAEVHAEIDLKSASDCEEAFDLQMYRNRAIDLIEWDDETGKCKAREVNVRYLTRKTQQREVVTEMRRYAERVKVIPGK